MLDPKDCEVTMTSSHKISFSIIDILDPNKFNSKRVNELSIAEEKFRVPNAEGTSLESDVTAGGDFRGERREAGREKYTLLEHYSKYGLSLWDCFCCIHR